jgi:hypothetical protein
VTAAINQKDAEVTNNGTGKVSYTLNLGVIRNGVKYNTGFECPLSHLAVLQIQVVFAADQFGIYSGSDPGNYQAAFFVYNGQVFIRSAFIQDGSRNAKIGNFIQSNNYVAGSVGWRLDKSGTFENYGSTAGEGAMKQTNQTISVRDANNVLRVQIGRITGTW